VSAGLFYLYFANCDSQPVSFSSTVELYNDKDGVKDYLSVGETELETVFWVSGGCLGEWRVCFG